MWFFDLLLRLYPCGFRTEYGTALRQQFLDEWAAAPGLPGRALLCLQSVWEFLLVWPHITASELAQDARYAWRSWRGRAAVTALAVASLSLAIGVSTGVFSIISATLYRSLPFAHAEELVEMHVHYDDVFNSPASFQRWQSNSNYLADAAAMTIAEFTFSKPPATLRIKLAQVTANFFPLLGAQIRHGRGFMAIEETPGKGDVAVLSNAFFAQAFGSDLNVIGQKILIDGRPLTVVGIAPPAFDFPDAVALWTPTLFDLDRMPNHSNTFKLVGRLKPHLSFARASQAFDAELISMMRRGDLRSDPEYRPRLTPIREQLSWRISKSASALFAGIFAVLLIACANMANLMLTSIAGRRREFQIREALGAGGGRIGKQILTECLMLASLSGLIGLAVAYITVQIGTRFFPPAFAFQSYEILDTQVLGFACLLSLLCGLVSGAVPAIARKRNWAIRASAFRHALLSLQLCLTVVLLASSIGIGQALLRLQRMDLGFDASGTTTATISLMGTARANPAAALAYLNDSVARLRLLPGVTSAGAIDFLPLATESYGADGYRVQSSAKPGVAVQVSASPDFFASIGASLANGRDFLPTDTASSAPVAIVNEAFAKLDGGTRAVLARKLQKMTPGKDEKSPTIVGVLRNIHFIGAQNGVFPQIYRPLAQSTPTFFTIAVRHSPNSELTNEIRATLRALAPDVPVYDIMPFQRRLDQSLARPNFYTIVIVFFGVFSLFLTLINVYSVCANAIDQRQRELAMRLAVGAQTKQVRTMILRQMLPAIAIGLAAGFFLIAPTSSLLTLLIETIRPGHWSVGLPPVAALGAIAALAIWLKTRSILRLDPAETLRAQ